MSEIKELSDDGFYDALNNEDHLGMVIRAHLYIEHELDKFLLFAMPFYKNYEKDIHVDYYTKVLLCCSLGLAKELEKPLKAIGTLRNRFAHNLETIVDESWLSSMYNGSLSGNYQKQLKTAYEQLALQFNREEKKFAALTETERLTLIFMFIRKKLMQANIQLEKSLRLNII